MCIVHFPSDIGGWGNSKAVIRACHSSVCRGSLVEYSEDGLISQEESRPFWIEYKEGVVTVGKGGQGAFMEWDAGKYHQRVPSEVHIGIASQSGEMRETGCFINFVSKY